MLNFKMYFSINILFYSSARGKSEETSAAESLQVTALMFYLLLFFYWHADVCMYML